MNSSKFKSQNSFKIFLNFLFTDKKVKEEEGLMVTGAALAK